MVHLGCIYALFGATYVVYATFIVTAMINERGFGENTAGTFWAVVGGLSIFSGPLFGWLSDRLGRKTGIIVVYALFTVAYALVAADLPNPFLYASIAILVWPSGVFPASCRPLWGITQGLYRRVKAFGFITLFFWFWADYRPGGGWISGRCDRLIQYGFLALCIVNRSGGSTHLFSAATL